MLRFRNLLMLSAVLAGIGLMSWASPAEAAMRMRIEDTGLNVGAVITDNLVGDSNPLLGALVYSGSVGNFIVTVTTGVSKPILGGVINYAEFDLNNVSISAGAAGTLRITLEDDGFTGGPDGPEILRGAVGGVLTAGAGSSFTVNSWVNPNDLVPALGADTGGLVVALGAIGGVPAGSVAAWNPSFTTGPGPFSGTSDAAWTKAGSYSIFAQATIVFGPGGGSVSFNENQQVLPAPGGLVLALTAVPGFGLAWLRRRFKKV